jgi:hypothetical protein
MSHRRFSLLPPSPGDKLLAHSSSATITLSRFAGEPAIEFELKGQLPVAQGRALLSDLAREFARPLPGSAEEQEGGAA